MQKIYIDTNIFSRLRANEGEEYQRLNAFLDSNRANLFIPFSKAHIDDLMNDSTNEKLLDAEFIEKQTAGNYYSYDFIKRQANQSVRKPIDLLNLEINSPKASPFDLTGMFDPGDDPELKEIFDVVKQLLGAKIHRLDVDEEKLRPQDKEYISKFLPPVNTNLSIAYLFGQFTNINEQLTDKGNFKGLRRYNSEALSPFANIKEANLKTVNDILKKSPMNKTLGELIASHNQSDQEQTLNEKFSSGFILLNFFSLDKEKNKKANFVSLNNDAQHSFFAAHCDVFITKDEGLKIKSKILYEEYGITIQVFDIDEFLTAYTQNGQT